MKRVEDVSVDLIVAFVIINIVGMTMNAGANAKTID